MKIKSSSLIRLVEVKRIGRCMSKLEGSYNGIKLKESVEGRDKRQQEGDGLLCWLPHPRTGIYCPKGRERVMDDVPTDAASFDRTYWLRNSEGVDRPDPPYNLKLATVND
ncbi:uncharacterized protein LOC111404941 [Olea europaea var. sylvestris]|uniref:uncharacterized protein LOC111404941 n=1 Tax=Olea europaea var. sylvestris TaxID=158386 RepID=UPI000C1CD72F|nr:uncharacterized protein LOC111404941 [Olea europaea var. sylvestris]